ncbi:DivIVA domain-containing protein [Demequina litorisediminis]|uniref:Cell wall synthesis protein Wag31 n=1 Tax=Demequina litorisediminis TaxID=1849022 RepID=A0ABQ6IIF9_9MICO|nr:DivIVA domain-containing protein [Demequina litorisediminis]GMA37176.1 hypothetical protein GCM10025876_33800 [Demequina litorisediminis]
MALLTAEDVLNKAFSKTKYREGFDQDEVDDFLDEVAHTISSLVAERDDLAQRLAQAQAGQPTAPVAEAPAQGESLLQAATDPTPPSATGMLAMAQKAPRRVRRCGRGGARAPHRGSQEQGRVDRGAGRDRREDAHGRPVERAFGPRVQDRRPASLRA